MERCWWSPARASRGKIVETVSMVGYFARNPLKEPLINAIIVLIRGFIKAKSN